MIKAYFAGGCFWGVQQRFEQLNGVIDTRVGYMGGDTENPDYQSVCTGRTAHAETVEITYDEKITDFDTLLIYFFDCHNPTEVNRQGPDFGTQYRTAIFPVDETQKVLSRERIDSLNRSKKYSKPLATTIEHADSFWEAEDYHQNYLQKRGQGNYGP